MCFSATASFTASVALTGLGVLALRAAHTVGKFHRSPCGHPEAQGRLQAPLQSRAPFSLAQPGARAGIARWPASR